MLRRIGTEKEITQEVIQALPVEVTRELLRSTIILDYEYGAMRDPMRSGGYSLIAESQDDVEEMRKIIDFEEHPCEWAQLIAGYAVALYLLNDDYSVVVFMPVDITPQAILQDLD